MDKQIVKKEQEAEAKPPFDFSQFDGWQASQAAGRVFPIFGPLGQVTTVQVKLRGPDTERVQKALARWQMQQRDAAVRMHFFDPIGDEATALAASVIYVLDGENQIDDAKVVAALLEKYPPFREQVRGYAYTRQMFNPELPDLTAVARTVAANPGSTAEAAT